MNCKITSISIYCLVALIINVPFIASDLYFIHRSDSPTCMVQTLQKTSLSITLKIWLEIRAYFQLNYIITMIIAAIMGASSAQTSICLLAGTVCLYIFNSLFQLMWLTVGSIMFWGQLMSYCQKELNIYMFIMLIFSYFSIPGNIILIHLVRKRNKFEQTETEQMLTDEK